MNSEIPLPSLSQQGLTPAQKRLATRLAEDDGGYFQSLVDATLIGLGMEGPGELQFVEKERGQEQMATAARLAGLGMSISSAIPMERKVRFRSSSGDIFPPEYPDGTWAVRQSFSVDESTWQGLRRGFPFGHFRGVPHGYVNALRSMVGRVSRDDTTLQTAGLVSDVLSHIATINRQRTRR